MRKQTWVLAGLILLLLASPVSAQQAPSEEKGFRPEKMYDFGSLDQVNTFNGNLTVSIPIGMRYPLDGGLTYGLSLTYNSKVWDFEEVDQYTQAAPSQRANAGLGWLLTMGRLVPPNDPTNPTNNWVYESPDGADHSFAADFLYTTAAICTGDYCDDDETIYTWDGSFLRMRVLTPSLRTVESGDGTTSEFELYDAPNNLWRLKRIYGAFKNGANPLNYVAVTYPSTSVAQCPGATSYWKLTDSKARQHFVCFKDQYVGGNLTPTVDRVVVAGVGEEATYLFEYTLNQSIPRSCHDTIPDDDPSNPPPNYFVPLLNKVKLPDGITAACTSDECSRFEFASITSGCPSGLLQTVTLPTLGKIQYTYETKNIQPNDTCSRLGNATAGVKERKLLKADGTTSIGIWTYEVTNVVKAPATDYRSYEVCVGGINDGIKPPIFDEVIGKVTDPSGNEVKQHYSVWPGNPGHSQYDETSPDTFRHQDYSLPIGKYDSDVTANLSGEVSVGCPSSCSVVRRSYVRYRLDPSTWAAELAHQTIEKERTVYFDDLIGAELTPRYAHVEYSDYDGFGHYRTAVTSGTFEADNVRTSTTNFNPGADLHGSISNNLVFSTNDPWVLGTYDSTTVTEGSETSTSKFCYDRTTGFLRATRVGKQTCVAGDTTCTKDLVTLLVAETNGGVSTGNVANEKFYGGDVTPLTSSGTALCTMADDSTGLGTLGYRIDHTYSNGVRATSKYNGMPFYFLNRDIHATGLTTKTRDTNSSLETTYGYDRAGRFVSVQPPGELSTSYVYNKATFSGSAFTPARITSTAGTVEREYQFDAVGRFWREKRRMPDNSWTFREMLYDALNQKASVSEFETLTVPAGGSEYTVTSSHKTLFFNYDAFGRARSITAPDQKTTSLSFKGVSGMTRTVKILLGGTTDSSVATTETYDRQGRLMRVDEPTANGTTTTSYAYDVGNRLKSVSMTDGVSTQQRFFKYDERGFLKEEQHPELGISGNGKTVYGTYAGSTFNGRYDARGHATRKVTDAVDLTTVFDKAERVTEVKKTGGDTLKLFQYDDSDTSPSDCTSLCGKLWATARFNYVPDLGPDPVAVTESFQYDGVGGRVSARDQVIGKPNDQWEHFAHGQSYNDLGKVASVTYPCRVDSLGTCDRTAPTVSFGYTKGTLTSVGSLATSITYRGNGVIDTVTHEGGTHEKWSADPDGMARPAKIQVTNASNVELWSSGDYKYDGSGNVKQIGDTTFTYDRQNRLTQWTRNFGTAGGAYGATIRGYDAFGNFSYSMEKGCKSATGPCYSTGIQPYPINGQTNHYTDLTYDALGNVTNESGRSFTYDALGTMTGANVGGRKFRYLYSAGDERIGLVEVGFPTGKRITWTVRGFDDQLLSTSSDDSTSGARVLAWKEDQFWRGGALLASKNGSTTKHFALDHLGSPRYVTNSSGGYIGTQSFQPFGGGGTIDGGPNQFTGHERDAATVGSGTADLPDYFHARYYDLRLGRFLSTDPILGDVHSPQTWNRYSYAGNNPINRIDPSGMAFKCHWKSDGSMECTVTPDQPPRAAMSPFGVALHRANAAWEQRATQMRRAEAHWLATHSLFPDVNDQLAEVEGYDSYEDCVFAGPCNPERFALMGVGAVSRGSTAFGRAARLIAGGRYNSEQAALIDLAKQAARRGVTKEEAMQLIKWAQEYKMPYQNHINSSHWVGGSHIRIGNINHIKVH